MIEQIKAWKCRKCERVYFDKPTVCACVSAIEPGNIVGCFKLLTRSNGRKFTAQCLLCGLDTEIDASNIRRQKSCGCKPRHCEILNNTETEARYRCKKCQKTILEDLPVMVWCCDLEEEE